MQQTIFTGGYTQTSKGIYICEFDDEAEKIFIRGVEKNCKNPNFIAVNWEKNLLCALNEDEEHTWITLYKILESHELLLLDSLEVGGKGPCHINIDEEGKRIFYANYESGDIGMVWIEEERMSKEVKRIYHQGKGITQRQKSAHPHGVHIIYQNKLAVPDLGTDQIYIYDISGRDLKFKQIVPVRAGDGPRHAAVHPNRKVLYVICELQNVIYTFVLEGERWKEIQKISILPSEIPGEFIAGEVEVTWDGKWLLASTRSWGENAEKEGYISIFSIKEGGKLDYRQTVGSGGSHPRMFTITKNGKYVLAANQYSDVLVVFTLDQITGELKKRCSVQIPEITCVVCK
ncbi:lactonase family protein [Mediterraneibacter sp. NSJ-55]|uniref:Lactonase family protein n=1 Tax=Mediterraneibacter hominis TaxID=2763054 RepID=A0A923RQH9_9FIRM|nr:beta-propeller fold lactonase family protein [Mediterraneibacter hominis]MBC5689550.1 lactonase family protein [Mediterraneibacter hominis]